jgi:hypothetical protein
LGVDDRGPKVDWARFNSNEANAALKAFAAIENPRLRRSVLGMIRALSAR